MRPDDHGANQDYRYFNPRTHVGCDLRLPMNACALRISIHAPTWGATSVRCLCVSVTGFQSTHPRGVRPEAWRWRSFRQDFNPRTHVGCDLSESFDGSILENFNPRTHVGCDRGKRGRRPRRAISIHAPTWGATSDVLASASLKEFQSTHPRGVRHRLSVDRLELQQFQSTHPRGVRRIITVRQLTGFISIHAPTWGATQIEIHLLAACNISIHAPTWGATFPYDLRRLSH